MLPPAAISGESGGV